MIKNNSYNYHNGKKGLKELFELSLIIKGPEA